jgi:hypothetical protein
MKHCHHAKAVRHLPQKQENQPPMHLEANASQQYNTIEKMSIFSSVGSIYVAMTYLLLSHGWDQQFLLAFIQIREKATMKSTLVLTHELISMKFTFCLPYIQW